MEPRVLVDEFMAEAESEDKEGTCDELPMQNPDRAARVPKLPRVLLSLYAKRCTSFTDDIKSVESKFFNYIMGINQCVLNSTVYLEDAGKFLLSLQDAHTQNNGSSVRSKIVGAWMRYLNDVEKLRDPDGPCRCFISTDATMLLGHEETVNRKGIKDFKEVAKVELGRASLPVHKNDLITVVGNVGELFFVMCFDMKKHVIELFDNTISRKEDGLIYGELPENIKKAVCSIIADFDSNIAQNMMTSQITIIRVPWYNPENVVDSGIFAIWHVENYMGIAHLEGRVEEECSSTDS